MEVPVASHPSHLRPKVIAAPLAALLVAALAALSPPAAEAAVPPNDHLTVTAAGSPAYRLDGDLTGGGISVTDVVGNYQTKAVKGQATLPGAAGGTATVNIQISRGTLGLSGTFSLNDPQAGVQITANVSGNVLAPADGTITWQANGTVKRGSQSSTQAVGFTLLDRRPDPGDHAVHLVHAGQDRVAILRLPDN
jgi:hypothetical protein